MKSQLSRTWSRLASGQPVTLGYLGGSITEAAEGWRSATTAWFRTNFPRSDFREVNAAIGGTGSDLGAFRCSRDLLVHQPHLVFLEFAVNDAELTREWMQRSIEGLVRQILAADAQTDIVLVFTTKADFFGALPDPQALPRTAQVHRDVAEAYHLPWVNLAPPLVAACRDGESQKRLLPDGVHPSPAGHALYAEVLTRFLEADRAGFDPDQAPPAARFLPAPRYPDPLDRARLEDAWSVAGVGWSAEPVDLAGRFPHRLVGVPSSPPLVFSFTGPVIGLYWLVAPDSGDIEWSVDGGPAEFLSSFDRYALHFTRAHCQILANNLDDRNHTLTLRVLSTHQRDSTGTTVRIGAFLVAR